MIEIINSYLIKMQYFPLGRCACKGKPFRWKHSDGHEVMLFNDGRWQLRHNGRTTRYGQQETILGEIQEYYSQRLGEDHHSSRSQADLAD
jgi:hypothetical protein